jgi:hypothetical protein
MVSSRGSYGLDNRGIVIRIRLGERDLFFSFFLFVEAGSVAHPSITQWVILGHVHSV